MDWVRKGWYWAERGMDWVADGFTTLTDPHWLTRHPGWAALFGLAMVFLVGWFCLFRGKKGL